MPTAPHHVALILGLHRQHMAEGGPMKEDGNAGLTAAARDAMDALHGKDVEAFAEAMKAFFEICDSQPHEEYEDGGGEEGEM